MTIRKAIWKSDTQFNGGSTYNYTDTEVIGSGDNAVIQLEANADENSDITYNNSANYSVSDSNKIVVDLSENNQASLKPQSGNINDWTFTTSGNYTYNSGVIDVSGDSAQLKNLKPTDATTYANFTDNINLTWSDGTNTGTATGGASVTGGFLDLAYGDVRYVEYDADLNADSVNSGCFRFSLKPNYSGNPSEQYVFFMVAKNYIDSDNQIGIIHRTDGVLRLVFRDSVGNGTSISLPAWSPTSGTEYEFELNYKVDSPAAIRLFINGVQHGTTDTTVYNRSSDINVFRIGTWNSAEVNSNFSIGYMLVFSSVQHTNNYTPGASIPDTIYDTTYPDIYPSSGYAYTSVLSAFTETSTIIDGDFKYQISSNGGSTWKWWNGSTWIEITGGQTDSWYYTNESNSANTINTNILTFDSSGTFNFRAFIHSNDGTGTPVLDNIRIEESVTYSTTDNLYVDTNDNSQISPSLLFAWLTITVTDTLPSNTDIRIMFSNDGRSTWLSWDGSAWSEPVDATKRANATSLSNVSTNFNSLPIGDLTLDVRLFLYTSNQFDTPLVDNINVTADAGYKTSGSYRSSAYKPLNNTNGLYIKSIDFDVTIPENTILRILLRHAETIFEDGYIEYNNGDNINIDADYIQWRANFTSDGSDTPVINSVEVSFSTLVGLIGSIDTVYNQLTGISGVISIGNDTLDTMSTQLDEVIDKLSIPITEFNN